MPKVIISVIGPDRPGIIAAATKAMLEFECNIENVSQTILQGQFSGIFIASIPSGDMIEKLCQELASTLNALDLHVTVLPLKEQEQDQRFVNAEPFIVTTKGPDRKGLVAGITEVMARHCANVTHLQAVFKGGDDPDANIMIYGIDLPSSVDFNEFEADLTKRADSLALTISIQHRKIFETINRII
jgi:glycine cleavage system transcriptional repressor